LVDAQEQRCEVLPMKERSPGPLFRFLTEACLQLATKIPSRGAPSRFRLELHTGGAPRRCRLGQLSSGASPSRFQPRGGCTLENTWKQEIEHDTEEESKKRSAGEFRTVGCTNQNAYTLDVSSGALSRLRLGLQTSGAPSRTRLEQLISGAPPCRSPSERDCTVELGRARQRLRNALGQGMETTERAEPASASLTLQSSRSTNYRRIRRTFQRNVRCARTGIHMMSATAGKIRT